MLPIIRNGQRIYPTDRSGNYRFPRRIFELLEVRLRGFKNREAAHKLAAFLARMNAAPERHGPNGSMFPIDRRALAQIEELGLAEYTIRGALKTLEAVGFIDRQPVEGSPYQRVHRGSGIRKKPAQFRFGHDFAEAFAWIVRKCLSRSPKERVIKNSILNRLINPDKIEGIGVCVSLGQIAPGRAFGFDVAAMARRLRERR